jgi:predicted DNA-binding protein with PD1-like motif
MRSAVKRLSVGQDVRLALSELVKASHFKAAILGSIVGSLTVAKLRAAGATKVLEIPGPLEIVAGTGTFSADGMHVHIAVSNADGVTFGGHLLEGCLTNSTVELVILELSDWRFTRHIDPATGYLELTALSNKD